jgi:hypothetical protein
LFGLRQQFVGRSGKDGVDAIDPAASVAGRAKSSSTILAPGNAAFALSTARADAHALAGGQKRRRHFVADFAVRVAHQNGHGIFSSGAKAAVRWARRCLTSVMRRIEL